MILCTASAKDGEWLYRNEYVNVARLSPKPGIQLVLKQTALSRACAIEMVSVLVTRGSTCMRRRKRACVGSGLRAQQPLLAQLTCCCCLALLQDANEKKAALTMPLHPMLATVLAGWHDGKCVWTVSPYAGETLDKMLASERWQSTPLKSAVKLMGTLGVQVLLGLHHLGDDVVSVCLAGDADATQTARAAVSCVHCLMQNSTLAANAAHPPS